MRWRESAQRKFTVVILYRRERERDGEKERRRERERESEARQPTQRAGVDSFLADAGAGNNP